MSRLPIVIMVDARWGITKQAEWWLLEQFNTSLGNSGNAPWYVDRFGSQDYPKMAAAAVSLSKRIAPMFSYPESRGIWRDTWDDLNDSGLMKHGNFYFYPCGDGDYLGIDEPVSRGPKELRAFDGGRAYQQVYDALIDYPGLKPLVTHPVHEWGELIDDDRGIFEIGKSRPFTDFGTDIAYGFRLAYYAAGSLKHGDDFWVKGGYPAERWAYLNATDLDEWAVNGGWENIGERCRAYGISCLLINSLGGVTKHLAFVNDDGKWRLNENYFKLADGMKALREAM